MLELPREVGRVFGAVSFNAVQPVENGSNRLPKRLPKKDAIWLSAQPS
jgi:hypothetical protein